MERGPEITKGYCRLVVGSWPVLGRIHTETRSTDGLQDQGLQVPRREERLEGPGRRVWNGGFWIKLMEARDISIRDRKIKKLYIHMCSPTER